MFTATNIKPSENRVLMLASVASMINQFNMPNIYMLQNMGYKVEVACNFENGNTISLEQIEKLKTTLQKEGILYHQVDFDRNVFHFKNNKKAFLQIKKLLQKNQGFAFIHCHSPVGGVLGRIAAHYSQTKVIYTAHGFHFYKGAPVQNWLIYYPIERFLARWTDILITINKEDYQRAQQFHSANVKYVPGVGIDLKKYNIACSENGDILQKRRQFQIADSETILLSVGELNSNKNHKVILEAMALLPEIQIKYLICGKGLLLDSLKEMAKKLNLQNRVIFLGYRADIKEIYQLADIFVFPSKREGLSVALMEAMASGLPVVCSNIRGNTDLVKNNVNGFLCNSEKEYARAIKELCIHTEKCKEFTKNSKRIINNFGNEKISEYMKAIYQSVIQ